MDDGQLGELYRRYGYLVHRRCAALLGSAMDADDALQEVFVRVKRYPPQEVPASALGWLYAIAHNCCWDWMKKNRREELTGASLPPDREPSVGDVRDGDRKAHLSAVLRRMDERTRDIGVLHFLGGMTQEEVAETTRLSRRTVGKRLHLFEVLLRTYWAEGGAS